MRQSLEPSWIRLGQAQWLMSRRPNAGSNSTTREAKERASITGAVPLRIAIGFSVESAAHGRCMQSGPPRKALRLVLRLFFARRFPCQETGEARPSATIPRIPVMPGADEHRRLQITAMAILRNSATPSQENGLSQRDDRIRGAVAESSRRVMTSPASARSDFASRRATLLARRPPARGDE